MKKFKIEIFYKFIHWGSLFNLIIKEKKRNKKTIYFVKVHIPTFLHFIDILYHITSY